MTRRVHKHILSQRAPAAEKGQGMVYRNKSLSITTEPEQGDAVTGAPVIELEYKHPLVPYLKRLIWRHINESGVVPRKISSPRREVLGVEFFFVFWDMKNQGIDSNPKLEVLQ